MPRKQTWPHPKGGRKHQCQFEHCCSHSSKVLKFPLSSQSLNSSLTVLFLLKERWSHRKLERNLPLTNWILLCLVLLLNQVLGSPFVLSSCLHFILKQKILWIKVFLKTIFLKWLSYPTPLQAPQMNTIITWVQLHSAEARTATTLSRAGIHLRQLNAFSFLTCDCCTERNESLLENKSFLSRDGGTNLSLLESLTHCSLLTTEKSHSSISFPNYRKPELSTHHKQYLWYQRILPNSVLTSSAAGLAVCGHADKKHLRSDRPATTIFNGIC